MRARRCSGPVLSGAAAPESATCIGKSGRSGCVHPCCSGTATVLTSNSTFSANSFAFLMESETSNTAESRRLFSYTSTFPRQQGESCTEETGIHRGERGKATGGDKRIHLQGVEDVSAVMKQVTENERKVNKWQISPLEKTSDLRAWLVFCVKVPFKSNSVVRQFMRTLKKSNQSFEISLS